MTRQHPILKTVAALSSVTLGGGILGLAVQKMAEKFESDLMENELRPKPMDSKIQDNYDLKTMTGFCRCLRELGALNLNWPIIDGEAPLTVAIEARNWEMVKFIIDIIADDEMIDDENMNGCWLLAKNTSENSNRDYLKKLKPWAVFRILKDAIEGKEVWDESDFVALDYFINILEDYEFDELDQYCEEGYETFFVTEKEEVDWPLRDFLTKLALEEGKTAVVQWLCAKGIDESAKFKECADKTLKEIIDEFESEE